MHFAVSHANWTSALSFSTRTASHAATAAYLLYLASSLLTLLSCHPCTSSTKNLARRSGNEAALSLVPKSLHPANKVRKATIETEVNRGHRPPKFWDTLSKVRLSRGAIREFDRRISQTRRQQRLAPSFGPLLSGAGTIQQLKRFSRHGGPDLTHVCGVRVLPIGAISQDVLTCHTVCKLNPSE